jgi:hypothetical protein
LKWVNLFDNQSKNENSNEGSVFMGDFFSRDISFELSHTCHLQHSKSMVGNTGALPACFFYLGIPDLGYFPGFAQIGQEERCLAVG